MLYEICLTYKYTINKASNTIKIYIKKYNLNMKSSKKEMARLETSQRWEIWLKIFRYYIFIILTDSCCNVIKICWYKYVTLSLTSDNTRLEVMSGWTHDQPMKKPLIKC
jgi:hypothetical protein